MRRVAVTAVLAATVLGTSACSAIPGFSDPNDAEETALAAPADRGPVPTSQRFDEPFPVSGPGWDATVSVSPPRIAEQWVYSDSIVVVDVRAVQASGLPVVEPGEFLAFDPGGRQLERIDNPTGTVPDPLVRSELGYAGAEASGQVVWRMPRGGRIGRIDYTVEDSVYSLTVVRQPEDPMA